jgi:outer membrane protein
LNKYIIAIIIAITVSTLTTSAFASELTLEQCIQHGLTHNPEIKAYQFSVDEAQQGINEAWGSFLPTLSINYGITQLSNGASGERDTDYLDQESDTLSCRLTQPLFTSFSGMAGLKRARQSREYRTTELRYMQQQLVREISITFYDLLYAQQLSNQWLVSVERLKQQAIIASAWVEQQLAPKLRLLEINVELSNARQQYIQAITKKSVARARLSEWLALDAGQDINIDGTLTEQVVDPCATIADCIIQSQQRAELKLAQAQIEASWVDYQRDYDQSSYPDDDRDYYSVTLNLSFKPFQGGRNISAWRKQKIAVDRYHQMQLRQKNAITTEVQTRYHQLIESRARIVNANQTLIAATEAYQFASKSAELGVVSIDDLLNAELRLTRAEISLVDSYHALQQSRVYLDSAVGI